MGVVLLANEFGAGLGHITQLLPIARALKEKGHEPVIVVHDLVAAAPAMMDESFQILPTPYWRGRCYPKDATKTFACLLADRGFARREILAPLVKSWLSILERVKPDLVIADHSPGLCVAAHGSVPLVVIGNGFTLPPSDGEVFPPLRTDVPPVLPEAETLKVVQETQRSLGIKPFDALPQIFGQARRFLPILPEVDPYKSSRTETVHGPLHPLRPRQPLPDVGGFYGYVRVGHPLLRV